MRVVILFGNPLVLHLVNQIMQFFPERHAAKQDGALIQLLWVRVSLLIEKEHILAVVLYYMVIWKIAHRFK